MLDRPLIYFKLLLSYNVFTMKCFSKRERKIEMKVKSITAVKKSLDSEKQVVKGVASDLNVKQSTHSNEVGISIGATINMGNYESMRIDAWGVEPLKKGETRLDASNRLKDELIQIVDSIRSEIEGED